MIRPFFFFFPILAICACNNEISDKLQSGKVIDLFGLDGRWAGQVTPRSDGCGATTTGLMTVAGKTFALDPFQGTTVINGTVSGSDFQGTLSRPGSGQQQVSISFTGAAVKGSGDDRIINGRLESGHCSWTLILKRA